MRSRVSGAPATAGKWPNIPLASAISEVITISIAVARHGCLIALDRGEFTLFCDHTRQGRIEQPLGRILA